MITYLDDEGEARYNADVCIIGAGAAGLTVAREMNGCDLSVLVLESGEETVNSRLQSLYDSTVVGLSHNGIHDLRFRVFGGSTTRWAGQAMPLAPIDFEERGWIEDSGWPFGIACLDDFYARAAQVLSIPAFSVAGGTWPDSVPAPPAFDRNLIEPVFSEFSPKPNFAETHRHSLTKSSNIRILLGASVLELVPDAGATHVATARARSLRGKETEVAADYFVVCCGGIETARLLLASDRFAAGGLGNGNDLVGRYFQDHPGFVIGAINAPGPGLDALKATRRSGVKFLTKFAASEVLQRTERLLNVGGEVVFRQAPSIAAGKTVYRALRHKEFRRSVPTALRSIARDPFPVIKSGVRHFALRQPAGDTTGTPLLCVGVEQRPNRDSRVYLSDIRDALGMRKTVLDWRLTEDEPRTCKRFVEILAPELERLAIGRLDPATFDLPDNPVALSGRAIDAGHHMGTTRMASDPAKGVVDADCRVFGLPNLYIGSASVFPTSGRSNPTFTLIALCIRIADTIKSLSRA